MENLTPLPPDSLFLAGPTAVGKSAVAMELARRVNGEIISVDSMQVYRGLDIGTAKPGAADRARVPHHLIDVVELSEPFDAARFVKLAANAAAEIAARGRRPIFCGGTGLYFRALIHGLGESPPSDTKLRAALEALPLPELLAELEQSDPEMFAQIDRANPRRIVRAVEVVRLTGRKFSEQRAEWNSETASAGRFRIVCLTRESEDLRMRIAARVDQMFADGLVAETQSLLAGGLEQNPTAMQALGYRQVVEHLRGVRSVEETIEWVKIKTRQFAKRQMTWFRAQPEAVWLSLKPAQTLAETADSVLRLSAREA